MVNVRNCVKDTRLTTQCFSVFLYYHWSYYKFFLRCLQIKSSLVLTTNYSILNARNCVKDTTLTTQRFFLFYFQWSHYNKYLVRYLQIKSSLVLITNYSIIYY